MYVPVSSKTASSIVSTSTVRSIMPRMRRASGPHRCTVRPEGPMNRISSATMPFGTFHARITTKGRARPGTPST